MKNNIVAIISVLCFLRGVDLLAQYVPKSIVPYRIGICYDKTSNLIFPSPIKSVDRGSASLLVQQATGVENILQVKAGEQNFKETNLTVITADGHFYSFEVNYNNAPATLNFSFVSDSSEKAMVKNQPLLEGSFTSTANTIKSKRHSLHKSVWDQKIKLSLNNIFVKDDILWLEIGIANQSLIPFIPAYARFFLQDTKTARRTATQQSEILPLDKTPLDRVDNHVTQPYVFAFSPFTVPRTKELVIHIGERQGSRLLTLHVGHKTMRKVKSL